MPRGWGGGGSYRGWSDGSRRLPLRWPQLYAWHALLLVLVLMLVLALSQHVLEQRPGSWPLSVMLRHLAAKPNCAAARAVGLAPARRGEPGYWPSHDADNDGIACEPYPRSLRSSPYPGSLRLFPRPLRPLAVLD